MTVPMAVYYLHEAAMRWAKEHPDHPNVPSLKEASRVFLDYASKIQENLDAR